MAALLIHIYDYFEKRRFALFALFAICLGAFAWAASRLKPEEDISRVLPRDRQTEKLTDILQNARFADKLVVMISARDSTLVATDSLVVFSDSLAAGLRRDLTDGIADVRDRIDDSTVAGLLPLLRDHLPVFLSGADYARIDSLIRPGQIPVTLARDVQILGSPAGLVLKQTIRQDPVGITGLALGKLRRLQYDENFDLADGHVVTRDGKTLLVFLTPRFPPDNTGQNVRMLAGLDNLIARLEARLPGIQAQYFGSVAVSAGNARQLRRDTWLTLSITVIFLVLFLGFYFRRKRAPAVILVPVVFGALFALAILALLRGRISVIALAAGSVVLGIAINYSLHVYNHFRHTRDIRTVIRDLSFPLSIGSFTTIGGFFCLGFVKSEILRDLGLFAAFSLIGAAFASLVFLPHLVAAGAKADDAPRASMIDRLADRHPEKNRWLVAAILVATCVLGFFAFRVKFDPDLMHMNFMPERLRSAEAKLNQINAYSLRSMYLITDGRDLDEALRRQAASEALVENLHDRGLVKRYSGAFSLVLADSVQRARVARWNAYWTRAKKDSLLARLHNEAAAAGFRAGAFDAFAALLDQSFEPLDSGAGRQLLHAFADDYLIRKPGRVSAVTLLSVLTEDKAAVYGAFASDPSATVVDRQYIAARMVSLVNADFGSIAWMTSILVFAVMLLTYGRIELTLVSFVPMMVAWLWILGFMAIAGISFNIVNIILSALIFGLGDDYSLFIMDGLLEEYRTGRKNLASYKSSIVLSAITTLAGLGVLIFAKHPALRSIALISITGILCVVLIAQVLIPLCFDLLIRNRVRRGFFPWIASGWIKSIFSLVYFGFGSLVMTVAGLFLVKLNFINRERGKYYYHVLLSKYTWSVMYVMLNVKKEVINETGEDFSKPAVLISNHTSFLDILMTTMLTPRMILLTNKWVWRSPVFGFVVGMADYYPVAQGIEQSLGLLEDRVKAGYSIMVFPEGTRSRDETIHRFHKGAFYLAEKLGLDILPILIHGNQYTWSKGDLLLKDGHCTVKILPRIKPGDTTYSATYSERAKGVRQYFGREYGRLKTQMEQARFFREQLFYNYVYKGPVLEWYLRVKRRLEKDWQPFNEWLPREGAILDLGCGYGFLSYVLMFTGPGRDVTGVDYDEDKIAVAAHGFSRNARLRFETADVAQYAFTRSYEGIVMSDLLHYLPAEAQERLIVAAIDHLAPGGILVIRDGDADLVQRQKGTRLTEFFSTRLFSFNKTGAAGLSFLSGNFVRDIARRKGMACRTIDDTRYTSNVVFLITHA